MAGFEKDDFHRDLDKYQATRNHQTTYERCNMTLALQKSSMFALASISRNIILKYLICLALALVTLAQQYLVIN